MNETRSPLRWLDGASLVLLVATMCSQLDVRHIGRDTLAEGLGYATKTLAVSLSDVIFLVVVLWFVLSTARQKAWRRLWWPPLPCWALIFAMVISALHAPKIHEAVAASLLQHGHGPLAFITKESKEAVAEVIQWTGYFLVAPWIFVNLLLDRRGEEPVLRRDLAFNTFLVSACVGAVVGALQTRGLHHLPTGLWNSPNLLGAFAALAAPLVAARVLQLHRPVTTGWGWAAAVGLFVLLFCWSLTTVSWASMAAMFLGLLTVCALTGRPRFALLLALALGVASIAGVAVSNRGLPLVAEARRSDISVASPTQKVKKQYVEWQAALGWSLPRERAFATGVGPGNYQLNIGPFYGGLPNEEKMPPDSNNLFLVQTVSIGALGLGALLWTVGTFFGTAWRAMRDNSRDWTGIGVVGALTSWLFVNLFHAMIVRGAGLVLAFLFALAVVAATAARNRGASGAV